MKTSTKILVPSIIVVAVLGLSIFTDILPFKLFQLEEPMQQESEQLDIEPTIQTPDEKPLITMTGSEILSENITLTEEITIKNEPGPGRYRFIAMFDKPVSITIFDERHYNDYKNGKPLGGISAKFRTIEFKTKAEHTFDLNNEEGNYIYIILIPLPEEEVTEGQIILGELGKFI